LIKNPVKMVVVRCLILCSKFAENRLSTGLGPDPLGELIQRSSRPASWIVTKGRGKRRRKGRRGTEGKGRKGQGRRGGEGRGRDISLRVKILATALY